MSEILDESADEQLFQKLNESDCGKKVYISSEDPIGLYNHAVKQFNAVCNKTAEGSYEKLDANCFYAFWMLRWWSMIRADSNVFFLFLSFVVNFLLGLIPILNLVTLMMWLIVYLIYEKTQKIHSATNKKLSTDPFKYMVLNNAMCEKAKLLNLYYEMPASALNTLGLRETQIQLLRSKSNGNMITFMIYNDRFKSAYTKFGFLRIVHILHILINATALLVANLLIYPKTHINEFFQST